MLLSVPNRFHCGIYWLDRIVKHIVDENRTPHGYVVLYVVVRVRHRIDVVHT